MEAQEAAEISDAFKQSTIEFFIRRKKEAKEIIELTGIPRQTVYDCMKRAQA